MKVRDVLISEKPIANNGTETFNVDRNLEYRNLYLELDLTATLTGGSSDPTYRPYAELRMIKRVEVILNGSTTLKSYSGKELFYAAMFHEHTLPSSSKVAISGAGDYAIKAFFPILFVLPYGRTPVDTILRTKNLSVFDVRITYDTLDSAVFTGGDRVSSVKAGSVVRLNSRQSFGLPDEVRPSLNKEYSFEKVVTAANEKIQLEIPVGNIIDNIMIMSTDDDEASDSIITLIELRAGSEVFQSTTWENLLYKNKVDFELESKQSGVAMLNLNGQDGFLSEAIDARKMSSLKLEITASKGSGTTKLSILPREIIPPAAPQVVNAGGPAAVG